MPKTDEPTAALTSRAAVIASLLLFAAIALMVVLVQDWGAHDSADDATAEPSFVTEGMAAPDDQAWNTYDPPGLPAKRRNPRS